LKIRHGAIVYNVVTYVCAKFGDDRLLNKKTLVDGKCNENNTKNNKNNKNNVGGHWGRIPTAYTYVFLPFPSPKWPVRLVDKSQNAVEQGLSGDDIDDCSAYVVVFGDNIVKINTDTQTASR